MYENAAGIVSSSTQQWRGSSNAGQTDCPRFTERHDWAENWNDNNEAITTYSAASDNSWAQQTAPDGTIFKQFFATSGWQTGLPTLTEVWSANFKKKWTTVNWTQDDLNLSLAKSRKGRFAASSVS
jgi:hypothetical protein